MSCVYSPTHDTSCPVGCVSELVGFNTHKSRHGHCHIFSITLGAITSQTLKKELVDKACSDNFLRVPPGPITQATGRVP